MGKLRGFTLLNAVLWLCLIGGQSQPSFAGSEISSAEELVAQHVKSLGNPGILSSLQSRSFVGGTTVKFIQGMNGSMSGVSTLVSDGRKLSIMLKFKDPDYPGEYFAFDGKEVSVGHMSPGQRSPIADFIFRFNGIMKEGFLGGALSVSWPLLDIKNKNPELKYKKTKVDGRDLYELEYHPKNTLQNMKIKMYFDPETFHHVRTEYTVRIRDDVSVQNTDSVQDAGGDLSKTSTTYDVKVRASTMKDANVFSAIPDSIYHLVEKFDDFKKVSGMTLPHSYTMEYSVEGQGNTFIGQWDLKANQWVINRSYKEEIFKAQK